MNEKLNILLLAALIWGLFSCKKETRYTPDDIDGPYPYILQIPPGFPPAYISEDNPLTYEGIVLGRKLFFDPILSGDGTQACADCHDPSSAFVDPNNQFSLGIDGNPGTRNAMPLFNLAWNVSDNFFWDGRSIGLEEQAFLPVTDPVEMHNTWENAVSKLKAHPSYPGLFEAAFKTDIIDSVLVSRALAQFERTIVSNNSKFDKWSRNEVALTDEEFRGFVLFNSEKEDGGADCLHCHGGPGNLLMTDNKFRNNGLDSTFSDLGLGAVTGDPNDNGKFRTPSLRNLSFTAPYMHDGRFKTLDEVIDHYSEGLVNSSTIDVNMKHVAAGGVKLTPEKKADLKVFLLTLDDYEFINNPTYKAPSY